MNAAVKKTKAIMFPGSFRVSSELKFEYAGIVRLVKTVELVNAEELLVGPVIVVFVNHVVQYMEAVKL